MAAAGHSAGAGGPSRKASRRSTRPGGSVRMLVPQPPARDDDNEDDESEAEEVRVLDPTFPLTGLGIDFGDTSTPRPSTAEASKYGSSNFATDILMYLDAQKVKLLQKEFEQDEDGLQVHEFVLVMKSFLRSAIAAGPKSALSDLTELQLVSNLCELFAQIDVNGDGNMEWDEFTSFVVEMGMHSAEDSVNAIQRYHPAPVEDTSKHATAISHVRYLSGMDRIAVCEQMSTSLKLYTPELEVAATISRDDGDVLCAEHIPELNQLVTSSSDLQLAFYDDASLRLHKTFHTPSSQLCMTWEPMVSTLFSAGVSGVVHAWDAEFMEEKYSMGGRSRDGSLIEGSHEDIVLDVLSIPSLETVASGSMDHSIRLWDIYTGKLRKALHGHVKGVRSLAYSPDYRFLVSAGFDYDALVWNPYVEKVILPLHGHNASLCGVEIVPGTPQIITADTDGVFKVWDIRNFACVQTYAVEDTDPMHGFVSMEKHKRLVVGGRRLHACDYEKLENPELTADNTIFAARYNPTSSTFITGSTYDIKVWNAANGELERVYRHLCDNDMTTLELDDRERKFLVGDAGGTIKVFDYVNGAEMKVMHKHGREVVSMEYCGRDKAVISASQDGGVAVVDEMDADKGVVLKSISASHGAEVCAMAYSQRLSLYATAAVDCTLRVWDFEFGKIVGLCVGHMAPITALKFADPYPVLVAADAGGGISLWGTAPGGVRYQCVARFINRPPSSVERAALMSSSASLSVGDASGGGAGNASPRPAAGGSDAAAVTVVQFSCEWEDLPDDELPSMPTGSALASLQSFRSTASFHSQSTPRGGDSNKPTWGHPALAFHHGKRVRRLTMYTADEQGMMATWDLSRLLRKLEPSGILPLWEDMPTPFPRRNVTLDARTMVEALEETTDMRGYLEAKEGNVPFYFTRGYPLVRDAPVQTQSWRAHTDGIMSVQLIQEPPSILTGSYDRLAKVWGMDGSLLGVLQQGGVRQPWKFKVDTAAKIRRLTGVAERALDTVASEFTPAQVARLEHLLDARPKRTASRPSRHKHRRHHSRHSHTNSRDGDASSPRAPKKPSSGRRERSGRGSGRPHAYGGGASAAAGAGFDVVAGRVPLAERSGVARSPKRRGRKLRRGVSLRRASTDFVQINQATLNQLTKPAAEEDDVLNDGPEEETKPFRTVPKLIPIQAKSAGRTRNASYLGMRERRSGGSLSARRPNLSSPRTRETLPAIPKTAR